jgi:hypothetical protein
MPGEREVVPASGAGSDPDLTPEWSFEDLQAELRRLHDENRPVRQAGEFTIQEYAHVCGLNYEKANNELNYLLGLGKVIRLEQKRLINKQMRTVFRMVK